ncbi:unnamed protein product, partial [Tetraodon nigroviridis]
PRFSGGGSEVGPPARRLSSHGASGRLGAPRCPRRIGRSVGGSRGLSGTGSAQHPETSCTGCRSRHAQAILAPSFLPSTLFPPHSFQEPVGGNPLLQHSKELDVFPPPSNVIKPLSRLPAVAQQISSLGLPSAPSESSSSAGGAADPRNAACSRAQLQETLIHLIKNDPDFLGAIHEAYLQSLSRDLSSMKL